MKRILCMAATALALAGCSKDKPAESPSTYSSPSPTTATYDTSTPGTASRPSTTDTDTPWGSPGSTPSPGTGTTGSGMTGSDMSGRTTGSGTTGSGSTGWGATGSTGSTGSGSTSSGSTGAAPTATATPPAGATGPAPTPGSPDADNTAANKRDRDAAQQTPMDQGGSEADRKTTQQIRKAVVGDKSLSFTAKNVKIITNNGRVTLRGVVKTDQERAAIEAAAKKVAGDAQVDNFIEVKK